MVSNLGWCASHDRREEPSSRRSEPNPNGTINTGKFALTTEECDRNAVSGTTHDNSLRRSTAIGGPGSGTLLGEEFPDFFSQNLITRRAQMDLVAHEKRLDRFTILAKHIGANIDVFRLGLGLQKILHQPVESQNILQKIIRAGLGLTETKAIGIEGE